MFESPVLGIDPGLATTGLAIVQRRERRPRLVWSGTVRTPSDLREELRLRVLAGAIGRVIRERRPGSVALERVAWGRNVTSGLRVARATGVAMLAAAEAGLSVEEYGPLEVKMAITGVGNADKEQVRAALVRVHGLRGVPTQADAADAVAVALCHLTQIRMRRAADRAGAGVP